MTKTLRMLAGSLLVAMTPFAVAQTTATPPSGSIDTETQKLNTTGENHGQTLVATRIATDFTTLAGSRDNALALVRALRSGTQVTLTSTTTSTTGGTGTTGATGTTSSTSFTPPTGKMGWGNVFISLALAQSSLAQLGITKPTAAQLQAALMGGSVTGADGTTTALKGVLTMRADGMGWGQIAHSLGTKLGPVVSAIKSTQVKVAKLPATDATPATSSATGTTNKSTAATNASSASKGLVTAGGVASSHASRGLTTAGSSNASSRGQGIVNAAGGSGAGMTAATSHGHANGAGVVSASGASTTGAVTSAAGSGADNGKGHGKGKGGG